MIQREKLENGITLVTEKIPLLKTVSLGLFIKAGSRYENIDNHGVSHFIEHLFFKGTSQLTREFLACEIDRMGGILNAYTDREVTSYYGKFLSSHSKKAITIFSHLLCNSNFSEKDVEKEKYVILQEINASQDSHEDQVFDHLYEQVFHNHPLGKSVLGTENSILIMNKKKIIDYYTKFYIPERIIVSASGDLNHNEIAECLNYCRFNRDIPQDTGENSHSAGDDGSCPQKGRVHFLFKKGSEQVHIGMGVKSVSYNDRLSYAKIIFNTIIGGSMSSRLFQKIREDLGLAYNIYSFFSFFSDTGIIGVYCSTINSNYFRVMDLIWKEIKKISRGHLKKEEVEKAKEHHKLGICMSTESIEARMHLLAKGEMFFNKIMSFDEILDRIERVEVDDVIEFAEEIFKEDRVHWVILGNLKKEGIFEF